MQRKNGTAERSWEHPLRKPFHARNSNDKQDKKGGSENLKGNLSTPETANNHKKRNTKQREQLRNWPSNSN